MNAGAPLQEILKEVEDAYFRRRCEPLWSMPSAILERCWRALDETPVHKEAAEILIYRYRAGLEMRDNLDDACELVRLIEASTDSKVEQTAGYALVSALEGRARQEMLRRGMDPSALRENPVAAIEECFFDLDKDIEKPLVGALLIAGYGAMLDRSPKTARYAVLLGMRQAYAFYRAGRAELAAAAVRRASRELDAFKDDLSSEERLMIGKLYFGAASGAELGGCFDARLDLLLKARGHFEGHGDDLAECLYSLGEEHKRRGEVIRALELYEEGLRTPGLKNRETRQVLQSSIDFLRAEWEGDFSNIRIDPEAFAALGFSGDAMSSMPALLAQMTSGKKLSGDQKQKLLDDFRKSVRDMAAHGSSHDSILHNYVVILKVYLELNDPRQAAISPAEILDEAQAYVAQARPETALDFEQVREYLEERDPLLMLRKMPNLRELFEGIRAGAAQSAAPKEEPKKPLLDRIAALADPAGRMNNLHTAVAAALHRARHDATSVLQFPLLQAIRIARESIACRLTTIPTAENAALLRTSDDEVIRGLGLILLAQLAPELASGAVEKTDVVFDARAESNEAHAHSLRDYFLLLRETSNWRLGQHESCPFARAMLFLTETQRQEYRSLCDQLSKAATNVGFNLAGPKASEWISQMRRLRAIAQVASRNKQPAPSYADTAPSNDELYLVELTGEPNRRFVTVARDSAGLHLRHTLAWREFANAFDAVPKDQGARLRDLSELHKSFAGREEFQVPALFDGAAMGPPHSIRYFAVSQTEVPLPWVSGPDGLHRWHTGRTIPIAAPILDGRVIECWSGIEHYPGRPLEIDEVRREVRFPREGGRARRYPDVPAGESARGALATSHFERWTLEDCCRTARHAIRLRTGAAASRPAFLAQRWEDVRALHFSTHGQSSSVPECSHLFLSGDSGSPMPLTFADILGCDWSGVDLVFLNACLTSAGAKRSGESALSLAWAFLAGGAKAVVANRWVVPARTAFLFARHFYGAWLATGHTQSVEGAFYEALSALRKTDGGALPHEWGCYMLLT